MSIQCRGKLVEFDKPKVMGIVNLTPDSFYDGGKYQGMDLALRQVAKLLDEGADMIDLGGCSTRPGATQVGPDIELERLIPVLQGVVKEFPQAIISVDTYRAQVAREAVLAGAHIINDISAGDDDVDMMATVAELGVPYVAMHKQGSPMHMQQNPTYGKVVTDVAHYLSLKLAQAFQAGIKDVMVDPGFGFGKTLEQNYQLLWHLDHFKLLDAPLLVGLSRKSMIYRVLDTTPADSLNGTTALHALALLRGAHLLRVHDVRQAKETIALMEALRQWGGLEGGPVINAIFAG
ncbi:MAG: dihydropteroate synthase [Bacteroidetes bacterium]|nr:dihydropteroate synthase [Bacteroidota bacterium]